MTPIGGGWSNGLMVSRRVTFELEDIGCSESKSLVIRQRVRLICLGQFDGLCGILEKIRSSLDRLSGHLRHFDDPWYAVCLPLSIAERDIRRCGESGRNERGDASIRDCHPRRNRMDLLFFVRVVE